MEYRQLGRTGVQVTSLCLGTMNFGGPTDENDSIAIINRTLDGAINFFDTANVYNAGESERIVGKALKENGRRDEIVLATKVFGNMGDGPNEQGASRYHIIKACEDSLRRLRVDHIDLYQLHRPPLGIPQDETLRAFDDLIRAGKVRYIGCSTHPAWMVMEALAVSEKFQLNRYVSEQPPYNLLDRRIENELVPLAQKYELALLPWSPLAGGVLASISETEDQASDSIFRACSKLKEVAGSDPVFSQEVNGKSRQPNKQAQITFFPILVLNLVWMVLESVFIEPIVPLCSSQKNGISWSINSPVVFASTLEILGWDYFFVLTLLY